MFFFFFLNSYLINSVVCLSQLNHLLQREEEQEDLDLHQDLHLDLHLDHQKALQVGLSHSMFSYRPKNQNVFHNSP